MYVTRSAPDAGALVAPEQGMRSGKHQGTPLLSSQSACSLLMHLPDIYLKLTRFCDGLQLVSVVRPAPKLRTTSFSYLSGWRRPTPAWLLSVLTHCNGILAVR